MPSIISGVNNRRARLVIGMLPHHLGKRRRAVNHRRRGNQYGIHGAREILAYRREYSLQKSTSCDANATPLVLPQWPDPGECRSNCRAWHHPRRE